MYFRLIVVGTFCVSVHSALTSNSSKNILDNDQAFTQSDFNDDDNEKLKSEGKLDEISEILGISNYGNKFTSKNGMETFSGMTVNRSPDHWYEIDLLLDLPPAGCEPTSTQVNVDIALTGNMNGFFPTNVRANRCRGCCPTPQVCQPTEKKMIPLKVQVFRNPTSPPVTTKRTGRRQSPPAQVPEYIVYPVEQHLKCGCRCMINITHCNPQIHYLDALYCVCQCRNMRKERRCLKSEEHYWDNDECKCRCRKETKCEGKLKFSRKTCKCEVRKPRKTNRKKIKARA